VIHVLVVDGQLAQVGVGKFASAAAADPGEKLQGLFTVSGRTFIAGAARISDDSVELVGIDDTIGAAMPGRLLGHAAMLPGSVSEAYPAPGRWHDARLLDVLKFRAWRGRLPLWPWIGLLDAPKRRLCSPALRQILERRVRQTKACGRVGATRVFARIKDLTVMEQTLTPLDGENDRQSLAIADPSGVAKGRAV
jgi:hypothetical protein